MNTRALLLIPLFATILPAAENPLRSRTLFVADSGVSTYQLADRFILIGTDSVFVDSMLQSRESYALDAARGSLTFLVPPLKPAQVMVCYERLPLTDLKSVYLLRQLPAETFVASQSETTGSRVPGDTGNVLAVSESTEPLALDGAKTVTVSFGSGGLDLDQSLRLNVKGSIAGVKLDAALSDQGTGIGTEGSTRELDELDRVLIDLQGRHMRGTLGDIDLSQPQGRLGIISRRLRGAHVAWNSLADATADAGQPGVEIGASYARPKGRFGHNELPGLDGRQGPYLLAGDMTGIVVVPGSERVYLDGAQLVRGWDQDYTIDYDLGELTFTNRHQIVARSRIEADFEYTTDEYERDVLSVGIGYDFAFARVAGGAFREGDDPNAHLGRTFTHAETDSLAAAGDTGVAWLSGADSVGFGNGDYVRSGDHFQFAGRDSGHFAVRFTLLGDSAGDYEYDNSIAGYQYVGAGQGRYVARQQVRLPERTEAYHFDATARPLPGLDAAFTGMLSRRSRNLFETGWATTGRSAGCVRLWASGTNAGVWEPGTRSRVSRMSATSATRGASRRFRWSIPGTSCRHMPGPGRRSGSTWVWAGCVPRLTVWTGSGARSEPWSSLPTTPWNGWPA